MIVRAWSDIIEQWIIDEIHEPIWEIEIVWPQEYAWEIMKLCQTYRWEMQNMEHIDQTRVVWKYLLPMWEIIIDFYDKLKSATKGYATMNYEFKKYQQSDLVKLDIFLNWEKIEALSMIIHKANSMYQWRDIVKKLKELIPRHMFVIPVQAGIWNKMIARENIPALKKDVIAKCYWWDITRKRKLLAKQKEWKKKMKSMWSVNVPGDVFIKMVAK
jgi:GTP-binding protein LepA